jgi:membrane dipeptidase
MICPPVERERCASTPRAPRLPIASSSMRSLHHNPDQLSRREFTAALMATACAPSLALGHSPHPANLGWPGYQRSIVIDALATPGPFNVPRMFDAPWTAEMIANAQRSGITAVNMTVAAGGNGTTAFVNAVRGIAFANRECQAHPEAFTIVRTVAELRAAKSANRTGLILGFQDGTAFEDDLSRVELFHSLGVRIVQLTYNLRNLLGDGCLEPGNAGLSAFGRRVVEQLNALGMLVDLSHVGERTTMDAIAASTKPVAFTHSGCQAVNGVPRNKTDAQLRALVAKGGVVGIYLMPFLRASGQPTGDDLFAHIDHAVRICGEDHVGIGSDLSITPLDPTPDFRATHAEFVRERRRQGISAPGEAEEVFNYVPELNTPRRMELIADRLAARGYTSARIDKLIGGNWMRLFGEVWR